jgi:hypothetical protein
MQSIIYLFIYLFIYAFTHSLPHSRSLSVQWEQNSGKCGVCGDAYHLRSPRPHEAGGDYGKGIISRRYAAGQVIKINNTCPLKI